MTNGRSGTGTVGASRRSASGWLSLVMATAVVAVGCPARETVRLFLGSPEPEEDEETETVRSALLAADVDARLGGNESHTAINPLDTQVIAVSLCFTISLSFDGGRTFNAAHQVALQLPPGYGGAGCDDVVTFDAQGRLFVTFLSQIPCTGPSPFCTGGRGGIELFVQQVDARRPGTAVASRLLDAAGNDCTAAAANIAQCPSNVTQAVGRGACNDVSAGNGRSADRQWLAADARPACGTPTPARGTRTCSPFSNNLYVIWTDSSCGNAPPSGMMVASSSDQGANWIGQALLGGTGANRDVRQVGIGIGANGDLYAGYHAQQYAGEPDGTSGQIIVYQSADGTATGLAGNNTSPFPAGTADITLNQQQCVCPGSTCAATGVACTFNSGACPGGAACECVAPDTCVPAAGCANNPTPGWAPCRRRLQTNGNLTWGSQSPFIVGDPTNPNNVAVFASTDPNPAGTVRDNMNVNYVVSTNAATATPIWSAPLAVTPAGAALPATNQLFPAAVTGLSGSCVTLAYYDDRSPNTNAAGNNMLDTFVTVNPNLWASSAWQAEVKINDVQFDPDRGAPDFFSGSFCVNNPACVLPAAWRSTSRMGEYNGLLQAFGYSFVNDPISGQTTMFDFSDGIPPVVTPPPPVTVSTCRPSQAQLGSATATDECGKPPLSAVTAAIPPLVIGPNTVAWSATDGADNKGTATQSVTAQDLTGPSFTIIPADVTTTSCTGVNIGQAFAQDDCGGNVTITNNAPAQFPLGTTTVTWTAVDARGNVRTATQRVTALLGDNPSCCPPGTNIILGNSNNNVLTGTSNADCILGRGAQDTINGNGGNDFISGGDGDDIINGGAGNDTIYGGSGQDTITGGIGDDNLFGDDGDDHLFGGDGNDTLHGGQGQDDLRGENNDDLIFGDTGDDSLNGGAGNDTLAGGPNNDTCNGDGGTNLFESCELGGNPNACVDGVQNGQRRASTAAAVARAAPRGAAAPVATTASAASARSGSARACPEGFVWCPS